jgi:hypothetical protein
MRWWRKESRESSGRERREGRREGKEKEGGVEERRRCGQMRRCREVTEWGVSG